MSSMKTNEAFCLTISKLAALLLMDADREPLSQDARKALMEARLKMDMILDRDEDYREQAA